MRTDRSEFLTSDIELTSHIEQTIMLQNNQQPIKIISIYVTCYLACFIKHQILCTESAKKNRTKNQLKYTLSFAFYNH